MEFLQSTPWLLAPAIMLARIVDVSLGTVRTILVFRGHKLTAAIIGFFEVLVWLLAAGHVLQHLDRWYLAAAYAAGFALGNVVGVWIEGRLALGLELVRAISRNREVPLADELRAAGYSVTEVNGEGDAGEAVEVLLVIEPRRRVRRLLDKIYDIDPGALCTLSDVRRYVPVPPRTRFASDVELGPVKRK